MQLSIKDKNHCVKLEKEKKTAPLIIDESVSAGRYVSVCSSRPFIETYLCELPRLSVCV